MVLLRNIRVVKSVSILFMERNSLNMTHLDPPEDLPFTLSVRNTEVSNHPGHQLWTQNNRIPHIRLRYDSPFFGNSQMVYLRRGVGCCKTCRASCMRAPMPASPASCRSHFWHTRPSTHRRPELHMPHSETAISTAAQQKEQARFLVRVQLEFSI